MPQKRTTKMNNNAARRVRKTSKTTTVLRQSLSLAAMPFSWAPLSGEKQRQGKTNEWIRQSVRISLQNYFTTARRRCGNVRVRGGERTKLATTTVRMASGIERGEGRWVNERGNHHHNHNNNTSQNTHTAHIWGEGNIHKGERRKRETARRQSA